MSRKPRHCAFPNGQSMRGIPSRLLRVLDKDQTAPGKPPITSFQYSLTYHRKKPVVPAKQINYSSLSKKGHKIECEAFLAFIP